MSSSRAENSNKKKQNHRPHKNYRRHRNTKHVENCNSPLLDVHTTYNKFMRHHKNVADAMKTFSALKHKNAYKYS